jgi:4-amino-4-deoxy-L-arabinose transferase-like glycosyltransferase
VDENGRARPNGLREDAMTRQGTTPSIGPIFRESAERRVTSRWLVLALIALTVLTFLLRVWQLNTIPPGLFGDEAQAGIDVQAWLRGESTQLFPHHLGGETLYGYLSIPFVALWDGTPLAIRIVSALMGALMIPALYLAGRALWREQPRLGAWAGLIAGALWMVGYWPQSVNRIGFQVNTQPLLLTLAVVAWLSWSYRPSRGRAATFGLLAALTLYTYPAARITPLLWLLLYTALPRDRRRGLRSTLLWAAAAFGVTAAPVALHFALNPYYLTVRSQTLSALGGELSLAGRVQLWLESTRQVVGVYLGGAGDPEARHNLPGRAAFAPWLAGLLLAGVALALPGLRRREQRSWTLLLWLAVLSLLAIAAGDANPHYLRLLGALPAALLLIAWPLAALLEWSGQRSRALGVAVALLVVALIVVEGVRTTRDYFVRWAGETDLYYTYQEDVWLLGQRIAATPDGIGVVPVDPTMLPDFAEHSLQYGFPGTPLHQIQVREGEIAGWLQEQLGAAAGSQVLTPLWHEGPEAGADAKGLLAFYLAREGSLADREALRGFDLLTYDLEQPPQFQAAGNVAGLDQDFSSTLRLTGVQWGAAYPNPDRSAAAAAAGTPFWAILTWRLEQPAPDLTVALDLVDGAGHRLGSAETPLLDDQRRPVSQWTPGTVGRSYHLVDVPPTQLPGELHLEARAYDSATLLPLLPSAGTPRQSAPVAAVATTPALEASTAVTVARPVERSVAPGVTLLGLDAWPAEIAPGQTLTLRLLWQIEQPLAAAQPFTVALDDAEVSTVVVLPAGTPVGHAVHTFADLALPPDLATGVHDLTLRGPDGAATLLGQIAVAGRPHRFEAPALGLPLEAQFGEVVALLGADVSDELTAAPGQPLAFDLVWQAQATPRADLVRFVHLLGPDGQLVAQQDTTPCQGGCPSSSWLPGEILVDRVELALPADLPPGSYTLAVGWYDAAAPAQRLAAVDAAGQPLADNVLLLSELAVTQP